MFATKAKLLFEDYVMVGKKITNNILCTNLSILDKIRYRVLKISFWSIQGTCRGVPAFFIDRTVVLQIGRAKPMYIKPHEGLKY